MYSKGYFVQQAFSELGYAEYEFDITPEQKQQALNRLDSMMALWDSKGLRVGYPIPNAVSQSSLDQEWDPPYYAVEPIYLNLALRVAPTVGKTPSAETKQNAKLGYDQLASACAQPLEMQYPSTLPAGAGNKPWRNNDSPFIQRPGYPLQSGTDGVIDFGTLAPNNQ